MSRTFHHGDRRIRVKGLRRDPVDMRKLARALINIARAEAERAAAEQHAAGRDQTDTSSGHAGTSAEARPAGEEGAA